MKIILFLSLGLLSSCSWFGASVEGWTSGTVETLLEMSKRKSMIQDTPFKTMELISAPPQIKISKKELCSCSTQLYGGLLSIVANDIRDSKVKSLCSSMGKCFFKKKTPSQFAASCKKYFSKGKFRKLARDRTKSIKRLSKARRKLRAYCSKV